MNEAKKTETIGTRFRVIRKAKKMNQCEFAQELGISQAYLSSIETDRRMPKLEIVKRLAAFGYPLEWIMEGTQTPEKEQEMSSAQRRQDIEYITAATDEMDDREAHFVREWISLYLQSKKGYNEEER